MNTPTPSQKQEEDADGEIAAGFAFRESLVERADSFSGYAPLWHGWALMDAFRAGATFARRTPEAGKPNWRDDPSADERWQAGCDFAMEQLCGFLGVDPKSVTWDAATETLDGDVQSVIGNIMRAKYGEDWGPHTVAEAGDAGVEAKLREAHRKLYAALKVEGEVVHLDAIESAVDLLQDVLATPSPLPEAEGVEPVADDPADWKQERVWAEEGGVSLLVEPDKGGVTLTIESPGGLNTATIARYRWDRIVKFATPSPRPEAETARKAIFDRIETLIEKSPTDGIAADGEFSEVVEAQQRGFIQGLRQARISAINAAVAAPEAETASRVDGEAVERCAQIAEAFDWYSAGMPSYATPTDIEKLTEEIAKSIRALSQTGEEG